MVACVGCSSSVAYTPIPWVMMAWARGVRRRRPLSGHPQVMYTYIRWRRYSVLGWNLWHVMVFFFKRIPVRNGLSPFLLFFIAAEAGAFVLQGAHACFMTSRVVWVAAVLLYGYDSLDLPAR